MRWYEAQPIQKIFTLLNQDGGTGYIVGGAVRDHLLDAQIKDVDFCSTHRPQKLIDLAKTNHIKYIETGIEHGTVTLLIDGVCFEVTSLREDVKTDGRHAQVVFGEDFYKDAQRRDFTFNALYMQADGTILDPLGSGIADVSAKKIKFIGHAGARIKEDYLRILRYFRFIARFGLNIDQLDYQQISELVTGLNRLSSERLLAEFERIYNSDNLLLALVMMDECQIFKTLFDCDTAFDKLVYFDKFKQDFEHKWLLLMHLSMPKLDISVLSRKLRLSKKQTNLLKILTQLPVKLPKDRASIDRLMYQKGKQVIWLKHIIDAACYNRDVVELYVALDYVEQFIMPSFPLKGQDLLDIGVEAGPEMGRILKLLEQKWLEKNFKPSKTELLNNLT